MRVTIDTMAGPVNLEVTYTVSTDGEPTVLSITTDDDITELLDYKTLSHIETELTDRLNDDYPPRRLKF